MMAIAAEAGLACPDHAAVRSLDEATRFAGKVGWPVYLKRDNTAGGTGVRRCADRAALATQFAQLTNTDMSVWSAEGSLRRGRQWLRSFGLAGDPGITIQAAVPGEPAFHTAVALDGIWLAGISADVEEFHPRPTGPSTRVRLHADPAMDDLARRLIAALGYNGFCGLDFIRRPDGGLIFLEFNARPTPVAHLGALAGADLAAALHAALAGEPVAAPLPMPPKRIALFPQDWLRDPHSPDRAPYHLDIPSDDPAVLAALSALLPKGWDR
jgi:biotin carboxylase